MSSFEWPPSGGSVVAGDLTDTGTDGITIGNGTGAVIGSGTTISQHVADTTHNGYLSSTDWNTFNNKEPAVTKGNLTDVGTDGITIGNGTGAVIGSGTTISQHVADTTHSGYLSSTDWNTFNGKQSSLSFTSPLVNTAGTVALQGASGVAFVGSGGTGATTLAYTNANTNSALVQRDGSGNFSAGTITASLTGTASGNTTYSANNHGVVISGAANAMTVISPDASATKVLKSGGSSADPTWLAYDNANTASTLVFRDSSNNFSAGTITASLSGNATSATTATTATTATNATNTAITDDTSTSATMYPTWVTTASGNQAQKVSSTKLTFNPSTAALTTTTFVGALTGTASGNTTYSASNHGVVLSSATNAMTVLAPDASTTKVLTSGGSSADPTWAAPATKDCWSGFHGPDSSFARTNTAMGDFSADSTSTFTEKTNNNFGTVTSYKSGSDNLPGIVFTPSATGFYLVSAVFATFGPASSIAAQSFRLLEVSGTTTITTACYQTNGTAQPNTGATLIGIYQATSTAAKTIALQGASSTGTVTVTAANNLTNTIEWSIVRL